VRCAIGSTFQMCIGIGVAGLTGRDQAKVVLCAMLLGTDSIGEFLCLTEFGVVAITLAVMAVGVGGL
jgi:hypothetical protein